MGMLSRNSKKKTEDIAYLGFHLSPIYERLNLLTIFFFWGGGCQALEYSECQSESLSGLFLES